MRFAETKRAFSLRRDLRSPRWSKRSGSRSARGLPGSARPMKKQSRWRLMRTHNQAFKERHDDSDRDLGRGKSLLRHVLGVRHIPRRERLQPKLYVLSAAQDSVG